MEAAITWIAIVFVVMILVMLVRRDWIRLQGMNRSVTAEVIDHRSQLHDNARSFAAIYRFEAEGTRHEVTDEVYSTTRQPPVGTRKELHFPVGRPDLARRSRPFMWLFVYATLVLMLTILILKASGRLH